MLSELIKLLGIFEKSSRNQSDSTLWVDDIDWGIKEKTLEEIKLNNEHINKNLYIKMLKLGESGYNMRVADIKSPAFDKNNDPYREKTIKDINGNIISDKKEPKNKPIYSEKNLALKDAKKMATYYKTNIIKIVTWN
ncbi:MAG: hypothetical protein CMG66_05915 [Candidatus Marinimicrobia bacterium]|nr:hypothetical protein [Candidatus Neomarinimicrobiota bacterium]|tara:strand:+ start:24912 stop:25322 length:411 start_codon:yes stop_codon:yes gene_type:complete